MQVPGRRPQCLLLLCALTPLSGASQQQPDSRNLVTTGQITLDGRTQKYEVRHLPPSSFPDLPDDIADVLNQRGCLIPQTYQAHHPENVIHGSFQRPGSTDWAVLCSIDGKVSLLVFFGNRPRDPMTLSSAPETQRLQVHDTNGILGFNWGIDGASPQSVHDAQIGLSPRPPRLDHDALGDSIVDRKTIYHYFAKGAWSQVELPN